VKKHDDAAGPFGGRWRRLEVSQASYGWHDPIVNVPPARVESDNPAATVPATPPYCLVTVTVVPLLSPSGS